MKTKKFNLIAIFLLLLPLGVVIMGGGCDDEQEPLCYKGKVISLNQGIGCQNIIEITEAIKNSELAAGTTISFNPDLYEGTLKMEDVVFFKVIKYEQWVGPATANCLWPKFTGQIEFCNK